MIFTRHTLYSEGEVRRPDGNLASRPLHELGLTQSILDLALEHATRARAVAIRSVTVEIGALSGVMADAMQFAFDVCCKDTMAEGARLVIRRIPGLGRCHACQKESELEALTHLCPHCGGLALEILQGEEMKFTEMEID